MNGKGNRFALFTVARICGILAQALDGVTSCPTWTSPREMKMGGQRLVHAARDDTLLAQAA